MGERPSGGGRSVSGPLFQGVVYVADLRFLVNGSPVGIAPGDLAVVSAYVQKAVAPIAAYARQYGPCTLTAGPTLPPFPTPDVASGYSDADLQRWVDAMAQSNNLATGDAVLVVNPPGVFNTDAKESGGVGVLGYHGLSSRPYSFVNALGSGFTLDDPGDLFAEAVSHELAEMTVDPRANDSNPEVCDGCGTNCQGTAAFRAYFDTGGAYLQSGPVFPAGIPYSFFISAIAKPAAAADCPAPASACAYAPPSGG